MSGTEPAQPTQPTPDADSRLEASQQKLLADQPVLARVLAEGAGVDRRQELMRQIRAKTGRYVITYIALLTHQSALIQPDDIMPFQEVLKGIPASYPIELIVSSPGGLPDTVEKIRSMCKEGRAGFTTVVPNYAKSAATLLCLGSDVITMGPTSELGPIDPQMFRNGAFLPAHAHINSYKKKIDEINARGKLLPADFPVLANVDVAFLEFCEQQITRSRELAREWLEPKLGKEAAAKVAHELSAGKYTISHGQPIDATEALALGLHTVHKVLESDEVWRLYWELYVRSEIYLRQSQHYKLFENEFSSFGLR